MCWTRVPITQTSSATLYFTFFGLRFNCNAYVISKKCCYFPQVSFHIGALYVAFVKNLFNRNEWSIDQMKKKVFYYQCPCGQKIKKNPSCLFFCCLNFWRRSQISSNKKNFPSMMKIGTLIWKQHDRQIMAIRSFVIFKRVETTLRKWHILSPIRSG